MIRRSHFDYVVVVWTTSQSKHDYRKQLLTIFLSNGH